MDFDHEHRQVSEAVRQLKGPLHSGNSIPAWCLHPMPLLLTALVHFDDDQYLRSLGLVCKKRQFAASND